MSKVDRNLIKMINNPKSAYYASINNWFDKTYEKFIPEFVLYIIAGICFLLFIALIFLFVLRKQVKASTHELKRKKGNLRKPILFLQM